MAMRTDHGVPNVDVSVASNLRPWYTGTNQHKAVGDVFQDALHLFSVELSNDPGKLEWIVKSNHVTIDSVLATVQGGRKQYQDRKGDSKVGDALTKLSEKIHYYGKIMDVLVSHNPEYTALFWGATKFLLVGVVNHQKIITKLSDGLVQIANLLPVADLTLRLYPVPHVRRIIESIYAHIIKFLVRALRWYQESRFMHMVHAITRPTELRYDDILATISNLSRNMSEAALASSQAEQRDMHLEISEQSRRQKALQQSFTVQEERLLQVAGGIAGARIEQRDILAGLQRMMYSGREGILQHLTALHLEVISLKAGMRTVVDSSGISMRLPMTREQVAHTLTNIAVTQLSDPQEAYGKMFFHARWILSRAAMKRPAFWLQDDIQKWNSTARSSILVVDAAWKMRFHLLWFCTKSISVLRESNIPVVWALKRGVSGVDTTTSNGVSSIDLIKYLVRQVILLNSSMHTDVAMNSRLQYFLKATTEDEWLDILESVLEGISYIYIMIDAGIMDQTSQSWPAALVNLTGNFCARNVKTVIKFLVFRYGCPVREGLGRDDGANHVVTVGRSRYDRPSTASLPRRGRVAQDVGGGDVLDLGRLDAMSGQSRRGRAKKGRRPK